MTNLQRPTGEPQQLVFYHGTSWSNANEIMRNGFTPSSSGLLGSGIYVAREDKARRFAQNKSRHGGEEGALIKVKITFSNPKYVESNDTSWQSQGYDACRASSTSASTNMEWCVKDASQVEVLNIERVSIQ